MLTTRRRFIRASAGSAASVSVLGKSTFAQVERASVEVPIFRDLFNGCSGCSGSCHGCYGSGSQYNCSGCNGCCAS